MTIFDALIDRPASKASVAALEAMADALEYLNPREDCDCDNGVWVPNRAMQVATALRDAIALLERS